VKVVGWLFLAAGALGISYLLITVIAYVVMAFALKVFRARFVDLASIFLPIAVYLCLELARNRQGFNAGYANIVIAAAVISGFILNAALPSSSLRAFVTVASMGIAAAVLSWLAIPFAPFFVFEIW